MAQEQTRREQIRDERPKQILASAKEVFLKKGYFASTMGEIAEQTGIGKGTVYYYFKTKDELYVSVILPMLEELSTLFTAFQADFANGNCRTGDDVIMRFHQVFAELYRRFPDELRVYQVCMLLNLYSTMDPVIQEKLWSTARNTVSICTAIIKDSLDQGLLPEVDPLKLTHFLWAAFLGIVQLDLSTTGIFNDGLETFKAFFALASESVSKKGTYPSSPTSA